MKGKDINGGEKKHLNHFRKLQITIVKTPYDTQDNTQNKQKFPDFCLAE
jgi:hypothetical protein